MYGWEVNDVKGKKKYFVVRIGRKPGIYTDVEEYTAQLRGFPNFDGKGFYTYGGALEYLKTGEAKTYYAIRKGWKPGIYTNGKAYQKLTKGFDGVESRCFERRQDAEEYMRTGELPTATEIDATTFSGHIRWGLHVRWKVLQNQWLGMHYTKKFLRKWKKAALDAIWRIRRGRFYRQHRISFDMNHHPLPCHIYTDGASGNGWYGWAFVVFQGNVMIHAESGSGTNKNKLKVSSASGETQAAMQAVKWMERMHLKEAVIYYDSRMIGEIVSGEAVARSGIAVNYRDWMKFHLKNMKVTFQKVKGHSGVSGNEIVDRIAKDALRRCYLGDSEGHDIFF